MVDNAADNWILIGCGGEKYAVEFNVDAFVVVSIVIGCICVDGNNKLVVVLYELIFVDVVGSFILLLFVSILRDFWRGSLIEIFELLMPTTTEAISRCSLWLSFFVFWLSNRLKNKLLNLFFI